AELLVAFLEVGLHLRRQLAWRELERRNLHVVLGAGISAAALSLLALLAFHHGRALGRNRSLFGHVLGRLGHGVSPTLCVKLAAVTASGCRHRMVQFYRL